MSLARSRRGRPVIACAIDGCSSRFVTRSPGETIVELRLRASVNGWRKIVAKFEVCPRHTSGERFTSGRHSARKARR